MMTDLQTPHIRKKRQQVGHEKGQTIRMGGIKGATLSMTQHRALHGPESPLKVMLISWLEQPRPANLALPPRVPATNTSGSPSGQTQVTLESDGYIKLLTYSKQSFH